MCVSHIECKKPNVLKGNLVHVSYLVLLNAENVSILVEVNGHLELTGVK